jgi:hypothetical protein
MSVIKKVTAGLAGSLLLLGAVAAPSQAANQTQGDSLINVQIGDITLEDINVGVAAGIAATACGILDVGPVAILGQAVDNSGGKRVVCRTEGGNVRLVQN